LGTWPRPSRPHFLYLIELPLPLSKALLHSLFSVSSCLRRVCNQTLELRGNASLRFSGGNASLRFAGGNYSGYRRNSRLRGQFLPIGQCFLSFVQRFFASIQFRFALSKLLFSRVILFLARAKQRKRNQQRQNESFFHITGGLGLVSWWTNKSDRVSVSNES
jgi:hypothetical protein